VLGLGMLAAAGAAVDYWPSNGELPAVGPVAGLRPASPQLVQDLTRSIPAPVVQAPIRQLVRATETTHPVFVTPPAEVELSLPTPPAPEPIPADFIQVSALVDVPVFVLALGDPPIPEPPPTAQGSEGIQDRLTDALKRTRESLKDARSSLRGAFFGVVGAVRRVSPFFNTNGL
jgi:hypothetical protein